MDKQQNGSPHPLTTASVVARLRNVQQLIGDLMQEIRDQAGPGRAPYTDRLERAPDIVGECGLDVIWAALDDLLPDGDESVGPASGSREADPELDELDALQREAAIEAITLALLPAAEQRRHAAAVASGAVE